MSFGARSSDFGLFLCPLQYPNRYLLRWRSDKALAMHARSGTSEESRSGLFFRFVAAGIAAAAVSPVSAEDGSPTLACVAPLDFARFAIPLNHVAARISARQPITIIAI